MDERQLILLGFGTASLAFVTIYYMMGKPNDNAAVVVANASNSSEDSGIVQKYLSSINIFSHSEKVNA
tara:strand:+ start:6884 stop:7087 length:204 start_codon:yes stop_codon:yes gene_type:complete